MFEISPLPRSTMILLDVIAGVPIIVRQMSSITKKVHFVSVSCPSWTSVAKVPKIGGLFPEKDWMEKSVCPRRLMIESGISCREMALTWLPVSIKQSRCLPKIFPWTTAFFPQTWFPSDSELIWHMLTTFEGFSGDVDLTWSRVTSFKGSLQHVVKSGKESFKKWNFCSEGKGYSFPDFVWL